MDLEILILTYLQTVDNTLTHISIKTFTNCVLHSYIQTCSYYNIQTFHGTIWLVCMATVSNHVILERQIKQH